MKSFNSTTHSHMLFITTIAVAAAVAAAAMAMEISEQQGHFCDKMVLSAHIRRHGAQTCAVAFVDDGAVVCRSNVKYQAKKHTHTYIKYIHNI